MLGRDRLPRLNTKSMEYTLYSNLKKWAAKYEVEDFIKSDPIQIPRQYVYQQDIEISAFVTSWISWGRRSHIIAKARWIDEEIFNSDPFGFIKERRYEKYKGSKENLYRTFTMGDFFDVCECLYEIYDNNHTMEDALTQRERPLRALFELFCSIKGIPGDSSKSACKRLCLFLRWMCRKNSPVDFGIWSLCNPRNLIIPLDVHVHRQALRLGLISRRTPDMQAAIELTDRFKEVFPEDPSRGDFALFGYAVDAAHRSEEDISAVIRDHTDHAGSIDPESEHLPIDVRDPGCKDELKSIPDAPVDKAVKDLSIEDVLLMPLFYNNMRAELRSIWDSREEARRNALKEGARLKSHPIDSLHASGLMDPGKFILTFMKILDKVDTGLSSTQRGVVNTLGMAAFKSTMNTLIANEKKRNNLNRDR